MRLLPLLALLLAGTASCDSWQEGWTDDYKQQFLQTCYEGNGRGRPDRDAYCSCVLEKTMATYPTIAALMENKDSVAYRQALERCR